MLVKKHLKKIITTWITLVKSDKIKCPSKITYEVPLVNPYVPSVNLMYIINITLLYHKSNVSFTKWNNKYVLGESEFYYFFLYFIALLIVIHNLSPFATFPAMTNQIMFKQIYGRSYNGTFDIFISGQVNLFYIRWFVQNIYSMKNQINMQTRFL